jgi:rod shape-determining protein MreD
MINGGFSWTRITNMVRLAVPQILLALLVLLNFVSLPVPYVGAVKPHLVLMAIYYWSIYRPTLVPPALCFGIGIVMDILAGEPLGINALILVVVQLVVRGQRRFLMSQPYTTTWLGFAVVAVLAALAQWGLFGLAHMQWPPLLPAMGAVLVSIFLFPFLSLLFVTIHRILPVATRMID